MWQFLYYATYHNLGPSLKFKIDDGDQYFKKKLNIKNFIVSHVKF